MARRRGLLPPMRGGWAEVYRLLGSLWAQWVLLLWVGAWAVIGLAADPGQHPAESGAVQVPLVLLSFMVFIHALEAGGKAWLEGGLCAAGLGLLCIGGAWAGDAPGVVTLGGPTAADSYQQPWRFGTYGRHLGGQLLTTTGPDGMAVRIGVGQSISAQGVVPVDGVREGVVGPWSMYVVDTQPGADPTQARISVTPREGGEAVEHVLRVNSTVEMPDKTQITLRRLSADYGRALGAAAQMAINWPDGEEASWFFVEDPGLDVRVGRAPWVVRLLGVEAPPRTRLGVRKAGPHQVALAGVAVLIIGLLIGMGRAREERV